MIGNILSAGASLLGGFLNRGQADKTNEMQAQQAALNRQMQLDFAQNGIQWKVADAKAAGVHPLYALGASTHSYSPVSVGGVTDTSLGSAVAAAGQDLSRAAFAGTPAKGRTDVATSAMQSLTIENASLQNDLLRSQIAKLNSSQVPPPVPALPDVPIKEDDMGKATPLAAGGARLSPDRRWSDGQTFEDRWGEWGGSAAGLAVLAADLLKAARDRTRITKLPPGQGDYWLPRISFK